MGFYDDRIVPRLVDLSCGNTRMRRPRERAVAGLTGRVVEIGFGSGHNVALYPSEVTEVLAVEPSELARERASARTATVEIPIRFVGLDGAALPIESASCDSALSTFTLCTIPDVERALAELRRVLRPGAALHFLEHGAAPDPGVRRWQDRLDPLEQRLAGGCRLTRSPTQLVKDAGFDLVSIDERYVSGPKPWCWFSTGVAVNPS